MTDLEETLSGVIVASMARHPRSLQRRIGPSEIGIECERHLIHKLNGDPEPERAPAWKPAVGTAVHAQLEQWFTADNRNHSYTRWVCENSIAVGEINGETITGSCDLFDTVTRTVIDWKIVGPKQLLHYKQHGPTTQYRIQAHLYGLGYFRDPEPWGTPTRVMIAFLPRDGELARAYYWSEPWDPRIAIDALNRINRLDALLRQVGLDEAIDMYPECEDRFCPWCPRKPVERVGGNFFNPEYATTSPA